MLRRQLQAGSVTSRVGKIALSAILPMLLLLALCLFMRDYAPVQAQLATQGSEKVGSDVVKALQLESGARVVIALTRPLSLRAQSLDMDRVINDVAAVQDVVLASVDSSDFIVTHKYQAVPALAGEILTESALDALASNPYVTKIDLDVGGTGSLETSVTLIGANTWHTAGITGTGVVAAVLDSGADIDHTDLAAAIIHEECFLDNDGTIDGFGLCPNGSDRQSGAGAAEDDAGHGTHVTGILASRGNNSSVGVAPGTSIVAIKVGSGPPFAGAFYYFSEIVAALDFIITERPDVQVINMSLVTYDQFSGDCDNSTSWNMAGAAAINTLRSQGVVSFASSGNNGSGSLMASPACISNVISVGATDNSDQVASFTDSNSSTDILAPGVGVVSSANGDSKIRASGTSMASPHAAGCAALLIASQEAVTPDQIEARLENSAVQVFNAKNGLTFPRIDCSLKPLENVDINGPTEGFVDIDYDFVASISPLTVTQPISYNWQATGQAPVISTGGVTDTASFNWNTPGEKIISSTAESVAGSVTNVHTITVATSLTGVAISGPMSGFIDRAHIFIASVPPTNSAELITYKWQVTGQVPVTRTGGISDTVSFVWNSTGNKMISVTALSTITELSGTYSISINRGIYLPVITK